jgi:A/G-specific adenine glycosylase
VKDYTNRVKNHSLFTRTVHDFYKKSARNLLWRNNVTPYRIFVSEVMLQQTQVSRVLIKFPEFLKAFPNFKSLASASNSVVLKKWQGMGYNRRALYLKRSAEIVVKNYSGRLPEDPEVLETFPGIGKATASSIAVFSWNRPLVFIETNIRRVFIHHFFNDKKEVSDKEILPLVEKTLDKQNPREWYYALMDYGSYLAKVTENPNRKSKHYAKQSKFEGSDRQIRSQILRSLLEEGVLSHFNVEPLRLKRVLNSMLKEGFIKESNGKYKIS